MFPLTDKIEKEEKIDPERIHKVPENGAESEAEMIFNRVSMLDVLVDHPDQNNDACKNVQKVRPCDDIKKGRGHIALRARRVQTCLDQLVKTIELIKYKGKT